MSDALAFIVWLWLWMFIIARLAIIPEELKIRLYELWYSTEQQAQIMSWLVR